MTQPPSPGNTERMPFMENKTGWHTYQSILGPTPRLCDFWGGSFFDVGKKVGRIVIVRWRTVWAGLYGISTLINRSSLFGGY
jgi:hypothetical protein